MAALTKVFQLSTLLHISHSWLKHMCSFQVDITNGKYMVSKYFNITQLSVKFTL